MGIRFTALGKMERAAVAAYVRGEYDKLIFQQPNSYVSKNAQTDPEQWQDALRELIAGDPKRVEAIVEAANRTLPPTSGFTLIEMSIVLVIIGLIVGGVLVGQSLIKAATFRSVLKQAQQFQTAAMAFRDKYNCLPGDCGNAYEAFGFTGGPWLNSDGDGNGIIGWTDGYLFNTFGQVPSNEPITFWTHLNQAGLIGTPTPVVGMGVPANIRNLQWWAGYSAHTQAASWPFLPSANGLGNVLALVGPPGCGFLTCGGAKFSEGLTPDEAFQLDSKIDDGMPLSGNVQAADSGNYLDGGPISTDWTVAPNLCVNGVDSSASTPYAASPSNNLTHCNLLFKLGL